MAGFVVGDPIDVARVRARAHAALFGGAVAPVRLGRLELGERIGAGAMGVVYEARDPELDRRVAVKVLHAGQSAERLQREARALGRLRHPNVVAVHDVGVHDGCVYLVMERVDGVSLRAHLATPRPWRAIVELVVAAARGVAAAHAVGLIHRDVKPDNVLVDADGTVKVVDFGLAVPAGDETAPAGTPGFLAPEVAAGGDATAASDQYALGAALRQLIGARPLPDWGRRAIARMTAAAPADRFPSMAEAAAALTRGLDRRRRAWIAGGVLAAALASAVIAVVITRATATAPAAAACDGGAAQLAEVWSPARRTAAIAALGGGAAAEDAARFVDRYTAAWTAMHRSSCQATRRGAQSARALDLRARCLDRQRTELGALVDGLIATPVGPADRALSTLTSLPPVAACAELARLELALPLPDAPATRAAIAEVDALRARAEADFRRGRYQDALAAVEPLVARARALGWRPLEAQVLLLFGQAVRRRDHAAVEDALFAAVTAAEAGGDLDTLVHAQVLLTQLTSVPDRFADAERWIALAAAALERAGDAPTLRVLVLDNRGRLAARRDDLAAARRDLTDAVTAARGLAPADDTLLAMSLHNLGVVLDSAHDVAGARAALEESLAAAERSLGPSHPVLAETISALADLHAQQGDHDRAASLFDRAATIATAAFGPDSNQARQLRTYQAEEQALAAGTLH